MMSHQLVIRVPAEMHQALLESAEENGRTLAQEVRQIIRRCPWLDILPPIKADHIGRNEHP